MQTLEEAVANFQRRADQQWVPASNGTETPTRFPNGMVLLYCYNPVLRQHAYVDVNTDLQVSDDVLGSTLGISDPNLRNN